MRAAMPERNFREFMKDPRNAGKVYACLIAGAMGDALGYPVEFQSYASIKNRFGAAGIRELVPTGPKAIISDDTQMTLFTNDAMVSARYRVAVRGIGGPVEIYVYRGYLCWFNTQSFNVDQKGWCSSLNDVPEMNFRRAPGNTCLNALYSGSMGTLEEPINNSKGCGGVMRTAPLGFSPFWGDPLETGARCAAITHGHPMGWVPAGMLSDIVYRSIFGAYSDLETLISDSFAHTKEKFGHVKGFAEFGLMIENAVRFSHSDIPDVDAIRELGGGWVGDEALAIAVYCCLKHPDDLKECLISAVNHSGDSDSTGAIAGNILGAWLGEDCIPRDWEERMELTDVIRQQAEGAVSCFFSSL